MGRVLVFFNSPGGITISLSSSEISSLHDKGVIFPGKNGKYYLTNPGDVIFEERKTDDVEEWIDEWRKGFSKYAPGKQGTRQNCIQKMKRFLANNPQYTKDQIFAARDEYLENLTDTHYMQQADYFIYKQEGRKGEETSRLLVYCETVEEHGRTRALESEFGEDL